MHKNTTYQTQNSLDKSAKLWQRFPTLPTVERTYILKHLHDYFPYGKTLREWYATNEDTERFQTTHHQRDTETTLDHRGARFYDADVGRFLSLDPLAADYPTLGDYVYVANNPLKYTDPNGKWIEEKVEKGGGKNGRDLVTIKVTGKLINFSSNEVDMDHALGEIKGLFESSFQAENVDGQDINVEFNFSIADNMDEVSETDHLLVLADGKTGNVPAASNAIGGMVAVVDADYFTGFYDMNFGEQGERSASHEVGHLLGLTHKDGTYKNKNGAKVEDTSHLMTQGPAWNRGNEITAKNLKKIKRKLKLGLLNRGSNHSHGGLPNFQTSTGDNLSIVFGLKNTSGRQLNKKERIKRDQRRMNR